MSLPTHKRRNLGKRGPPQKHPRFKKTPLKEGETKEELTAGDLKKKPLWVLR